MRIKAQLLSLVLATTILSACSAAVSGPTSATVDASTATDASASTSTGLDAVSSASIVDNADGFEKAIARDGKWIIAITKDVTINKDLVLDGEFKNGKKDDAGKELVQRKIALYAQDDKRNITARYTLTAPKLTIASPMASIQHGTFVGDIYVSANDFQLIDAKVEGSVYFTSEEFMNSFKMDDKSSVTGKQEVSK